MARGKGGKGTSVRTEQALWQLTDDPQISVAYEGWACPNETHPRRTSRCSAYFVFTPGAGVTSVCNITGLVREGKWAMRGLLNLGPEVPWLLTFHQPKQVLWPNLILHGGELYSCPLRPGRGSRWSPTVTESAQDIGGEGEPHPDAFYKWHQATWDLSWGQWWFIESFKQGDPIGSKEAKDQHFPYREP